MNVRDYGANSLDLFDSLDPVGSSLKTSLLSALEAMTGSRMTWKQQATPCKRSWSVLTTLERPTDESACGLLPTPKNSDHRSGMPERYGPGQRRSNLNDAAARMLLPTPAANDYGSNQGGAAGRTGQKRHSLSSQARMGLLPTPTRSDANSSGAAGYSTASGRHPGTTLTDALVRGYLPTPTARDWKDGSADACRNVPVNGLLGRHVHTITTGDGARRLNPRFVEWMMGFPDGWTELDVLDWLRSATRSSRKSRKQSGGQS